MKGFYMRIAICDDIKECNSLLKTYTDEFFSSKGLEYEIDEFTCGKAFLESEHNYDIVFLDVELGDLNGIEIAKLIQDNSPNTIIMIITSYRKYLDEAMDINVTRYIDKPITKQRIFLVLEKAIDVIQNKFLSLHTADKSIIRVNINNIVYIESKLKKLTFYTINDCFLAKESLKAVRAALNLNDFATPHNSYIVNLNYIKEFKRDSLLLIEPYEGVRIPIAPRRQSAFKREFLDFIGESVL